MKTKQFSLLQLFSIVDDRLSTNMDDVCDMLNHICNVDLSTIGLIFAMDMLRKNNPDWYVDLKNKLKSIKEKLNTNDFNILMDYIKSNNEIYEIPQLSNE